MNLEAGYLCFISDGGLVNNTLKFSYISYLVTKVPAFKVLGVNVLCGE